MYNVEYLPSAVRDLSEIVRYIRSELDNPTAAQRLAEKLMDAAERLAEFPYAHPVYVPIHPLKTEYRKIVVQNYLLFYSVDEKTKTVLVARVIYGKRNIEHTLS